MEHPIEKSWLYYDKPTLFEEQLNKNSLSIEEGSSLPGYIRVVGLANNIHVLLLNIVYAPEVDFWKHTKFFTHWGADLTLFYFILASLNLYTKVLPRTTLFLWHLCLALEVIITIGFWTLLAEKMLGRFDNFGGKAWCALVHMIPLVTLSLEGFVYSRSFTNRSCIAIAAVGIVYLPWNAFMAFEAGKNVYGFLPWI